MSNDNRTTDKFYIRLLEVHSEMIKANLPLPSGQCVRCDNVIYKLNNFAQCISCGYFEDTSIRPIITGIDIIKDEFKDKCNQSRNYLNKSMEAFNE